jgi:hypothetical protein
MLERVSLINIPGAFLENLLSTNRRRTMMESTTTTLGSLDLSKVILAIGDLGTAAYGVVDAMKAFDR